MTFLTAAQSAAIRLISKKPTTFFSATDAFSLEICDLANEIATDLMKSQEWRVLTTLKEMNGDGTVTAFDLPDDFDRLTVGGRVFRGKWPEWDYAPVQDLNQWRDLVNGEPTVSPGFWIILGGQMQFQPAITAGETAQFYYISKNIVASKAGAPQAQFLKDDDTLRVDERLLTLGLIWKWRENKGIPRPGDQENYEKALSEVTGKDRGSQIIRVGRGRWSGDVGMAYPRSLGS